MKRKLLFCLLAFFVNYANGQSLQQITGNRATSTDILTMGSINITGNSFVSVNVPSNISSLNGLRINVNIANVSHNGITYQSGGGAAIDFYRDGAYETGMDFYTNSVNN